MIYSLLAFHYRQHIRLTLRKNGRKVNCCMLGTGARAHLRRLISEPLNRIYIAYCRALQKCYKSCVVYFSAVRFFKQHSLCGFWCQCSGVSFLRTEVRRQPATSPPRHARGLSLSKAAESKTDCKKLEEEAFNLNSFLCHLFTDT